MMKDNDQASDKPNLKDLTLEFQRAGTISHWASQREQNDLVRFCRWPGQTIDGKKHRAALNAEPFPWEGASDARIPLCDEIINDLGDVFSNAFKRAKIQAQPREAGDLVRAGNLTKVLTYYRDRDAAEFAAEAELIWQYGLGYGAAVWECTWETNVTMRQQPVSMETLQKIAKRIRAESKQRQLEPDEQTMAELPELILDPNWEDELVRVFMDFSAETARSMVTGELVPENFQISAKAARRVIRELRTQGESEFAVPYVRRNGPCVIARQVGVDLFVPPETTELKRAQVIFVREWMSEADLAEKVAVEQWDEAWREKAVKTKGKSSVWGITSSAEVGLLRPDGESHQWATIDGRHGLIEVIHAYKRYISDEGVPQVWCTVFSPHFDSKDGAQTLLCAYHEPLNYLHGDYPFCEYRRERLGRRLADTRGIPEVAQTWQDEIKRQSDMLADRASVEINPPVLINNRLSMRYQYGPGKQIPSIREGDVTPFPAPTGSPQLAFNVMEAVEKRTANYFGLMSPHVLPAKWQARLQAAVDRYLSSAQAMLTQLAQLVQQMASDQELARIAGENVNFPRSADEIAGQYDVTLDFNVQDLDMEFVLKKLEAVSKLAVPLDRAGVIDVSQLVRLIVSAIDPSYVRALVVDNRSASQSLFKDVRTEVGLMWQGNEADYVENDPTAERKLQFLHSIVEQNPSYVEALRDGSNPRFVKLMQNYEKNLEQSVVQEKNKQVGRLGVQPVGA